MEDRLDTITRFYFEHCIARLNIEYYKKLLETEIDEAKRRIVTRLLAEEHANVVQTISKAIVCEAEKDPDQKSADRRYWMPAILFHCPTTGLSVQGRIVDDPTGHPEQYVERYELVTCPSCMHIHLVNPKTGEVLIEKLARRVRTSY